MNKSVCLLMFALSAPGAYAGALDPEAGPGSTMYTLTELYQKLELIDARTASAPAPSTNNAGAVSADVLSGKEFWSLTASEWGPRTGTIPNQGAGPSITPTSEVQTISSGYYSTDISVQGDADLIAANVRSGVDIFGVVGALSGGGGQIPKTGAKTSLHSGDDGDLQAGQPDGDRYTNNGNGTVTDNFTGLMWTHGSAGSATYTASLSAIANLTTGGFTDWRMPNANEGLSLYPMPDTQTAFVSVPTFWSSSPRLSDAGARYVIDPRTGLSFRDADDVTSLSYLACRNAN